MQDDYKDSVDGKPSIDRNGSTYTDPEKAGQAGHHEDVARRSSKYDTGDPFGDETDAEVKYRTLEWWQAGMIMIAETISLGVLALPSVLGAIGIVGGILLILGLGIIATYTGYVFGQFKEAYPHVHNMADAGEVLMGRFGKELFGAGTVLFLLFVMGSHILTFTIAFNAMTGHATCTIVWGVIGMIVLFLFTLPRTLKNIAHLSIASAISVVVAVIITMVGVGIEKPDPTVQVSTTIGFAPAFLAVTNIIFAYAGHLGFMSFISEMKNPKDFPRALILLQATDISLYLIAAIVIYRYAGPNVASPALGSTADTVKRVAYGIALPTIVIAGVIYAHVAAKYIYVRIFRGTKHMASRSWLAVGSWLGIISILWIIAFIIAESIPTFNNLLGLISSLFASWFTYGIAGAMWLYLNAGNWFKNWKKMSLFVLNVINFCIGAVICGVGLYASGKAIHDSAGEGAVWSCADNSKGE